MTLDYLDMNIEHIREYNDHGSLVTVENACIGRRVCRGKHWSTKWNALRASGTVIGYVGSSGLVGEKIDRAHNQVREGQYGWCVVEWEDIGRRSIYPIGADGIYSLSYL